MSYSVKVVVRDNSFANSQPTFFTFEAEHWLDGVLQIQYEYSAQFRGGRHVDVNRLEIVSLVMIPVEHDETNCG